MKHEIVARLQEELTKKQKYFFYVTECNYRVTHVLYSVTTRGIWVYDKNLVVSHDWTTQ